MMSSARKRAYQHKAYAEIAHMKQKLMLKEHHFSVMEQMNKILAAKYDEQTAKLAESEAKYLQTHNWLCDRNEQLAEAMKDAERYRFLRSDERDNGFGVWNLKDGAPIEKGWMTHEELDESIDAAIRAMKEE